MLIRFTSHNDSPIYINPRYVVAVQEDKHFGRPGVGEKSEYSDTLIRMTKGDFNVKESPDVVVGEVNKVPDEPAVAG